MNLGEVVEHRVQRHGAGVVLNLLAKAVSEPSEAAAGSANSELVLSGNSDHLGGPAEASGRTPASDPTGGAGGLTCDAHVPMLRTCPP